MDVDAFIGLIKQNKFQLCFFLLCQMFGLCFSSASPHFDSSTFALCTTRDQLAQMVLEKSRAYCNLHRHRCNKKTQTYNRFIYPPLWIVAGKTSSMNPEHIFFRSFSSSVCFCVYACSSADMPTNVPSNKHTLMQCLLMKATRGI